MLAAVVKGEEKAACVNAYNSLASHFKFKKEYCNLQWMQTAALERDEAAVFPHEIDRPRSEPKK